MNDVELFTIACNLAGGIRREVLNGRLYVVAPATILVAGVLNGSDGPGYYPPEKVVDQPAAWNHVPVTLYHPVANDGSKVSAGTPGVLDKQGCGFLLNSSAKNGKLKTEVWLDVELADRLDRRLVSALETGKPMEVSTGVFLSKQQAPEGSTHNGVVYEWVVTGMQPDHLAILPDGKGACSLRDGCGLLVNEGPWKDVAKLLQAGAFAGAVTTNAEPSHRDVRRALGKLIREKHGQSLAASIGLQMDEAPLPFVEDVFDKNVIFSLGDKLFTLGYSKDLGSGKIALSDDAPIEVRRMTTYEPVTNAAESPKHQPPKSRGQPMDREAIINHLVANCDCWEESDRETLNAMPDAKLEQLKSAAEKAEQQAKVAKAAKDGVLDDGTGKQIKFNDQSGTWEVVGNDATDQDKKNGDAKQTTDDWLASAPPEIQSAVRNAINIEAQEKQKLVDDVMQAATGTDDEKTKLRATLNALALDDLRPMAIIKKKQESQEPFSQRSVTSRLGAEGGAVPASNRDKHEILPLPEFSFKPKKQQA